MKKKFCDYVKITLPIIIWPLVLGNLLIFFPKETAKYLCGNNLNLDEIVSNGKNYLFGSLCLAFVFIVCVVNLFRNRNLCIIKIDGLRNNTLPLQNVFALGKQDFHIYNVTVGNEEKSELIDAFQRLIYRFDYSFEENLEYDKYYFYGVSYIPFIFKLGNMYSDNKKYVLFHMARPNITTSKREKLSIIPSKLNCSLKEDVVYGDCSELVVRLFTTFKPDVCSDPYLSKFDCLTYYIDGVEPGFDCIKNRKMLDFIAQKFAEKMREFQKNKNYRNVHILLATSAEMVFALGTILNQSYDGKYIVYHYDGKEKKYTWGIKMYENNSAKAIFVPKVN